MKLIIIRHGDPDYSIDSLTEKGWREAEYLCDRITKLDVKNFYVSPLGRAKDTISFALKKMNRTATECEWLREFAARIPRPDFPGPCKVTWDWLPQDWTVDENYYDVNQWHTTDIMKAGNVKEEYDWVIKNFDALLASHGYVRNGHLYRAEQPNEDTIVLVCHFGLECVLLSHLLGVSPMVLWHGFCAAPTSVTTLTTEERREGTAIFRINQFGDISHLYVKGEEPAFAARFCETYHTEGQRRNDY